MRCLLQTLPPPIGGPGTLEYTSHLLCAPPLDSACVCALVHVQEESSAGEGVDERDRQSKACARVS